MTVFKVSSRTDDLVVVAPKSRRRFGKLQMMISVPILLVLLSILVTFTFNYIPSESMLPTLKPGDHIMTMRSMIAYPFGKMPERGDIVVFRLPGSSNQETLPLPRHSAGGQSGSADTPRDEILIKRIVGLPGETVQIVSGKVTINGKTIEEPYATIPADETVGSFYSYAADTPLKIPEGEFFLLGDNRNNSDDGRFWGTLKRGAIIGRFTAVMFHDKIETKKDGSASGR